MILFIIIDTYENAHKEVFWRNKFTLEVLSGDMCLPLHYSHITPELISKLSPWAICHSGASAEFSTYDVMQHAGYRWLVTDCDVPQIGFCGGHQLMAAILGSTLGHMRSLREGEADLQPQYHAGLFKEWGYYPVEVVTSDPLFNDLPNPITVQEYHMDEVKTLAPELRLMATGENCRVQAYKHMHRPLYGTQFHPELSDADHPHGTQLLRNFFALACPGKSAI
jgi:GMP synthase-like glutamine amidotransferase